MTWSNLKRWREVEDLELQSKRYRKDTSKSGPSAAESMAPAKQRSTEDALAYLRLVRETFKDDPSKYKDLLRILRDFQSKKIDTKSLVSLVKTLFDGHPELLSGLNDFLPKDYQIGSSGVVELSSSTEEEGRPSPSDQPARNPEEMGPEKRSLDLQRALSFVNKVKARFSKEEHVYTGFLGILNLYRKGTEIDEVTQRIARLFGEHVDLVEEFIGFLPPHKKPLSSSGALGPTVQKPNNSGRDDKANGMPQIDQMRRKESSERATTPLDSHLGAEAVGERAEDHSSSPQAKRQCREKDKDAEVDIEPTHSSPSAKRQRKNDGEDEKDVAVHSKKQDLTTEEKDQTHSQHSVLMPDKQLQTTGMVADENDKAGPSESEEHLKGVGEPMDVCASQESPQKHSPSKVRMHRKKSNMVEEENDSDLGKRKEPPGGEGEGEGMNVGPSKKRPQEHSLHFTRKLQRRNRKVQEENGRTLHTGSMDPAQDGGMQTDIRALQMSPQEHSSPTTRKVQTKSAEVEEEKNSTQQIDKKSSEEGIECLLSQEPQPPKISNQEKKVDEGTVQIVQFESSQSETEGGDQTDLCVSTKQSQEQYPFEITKQQKSEKLQQENGTTCHSENSQESNKVRGEQTDDYVSKKLSQEHSPKIRREQRKSQKVHHEPDIGGHNESTESMKEVADQTDLCVLQNLSQECSKNRKQQKSEKGEENSYSSHHSGSKTPAKEGEDQGDSISQVLALEHTPKIREPQKGPDKLEEGNDIGHYYKKKNSLNKGKQMNHGEAQKVSQEHSPPKIRKHRRRTARAEEVDDTTHPSVSQQSAQEVGHQTNASEYQILPQLHSPSQARKQKIGEDNGTTCQYPSQEYLKEAAKQTDMYEQLPTARSLKVKMRQMKTKIQDEDLIAEQSPSKVMSQLENTGKEGENNLKRRDESGKKGSEQVVVDASEQVVVDASEQVVVDASDQVPQKRSSARLARELIRKQCQAADAGLAVKAVCNLEEEQRRKRLQQLEDKRKLMLQQKQQEFSEKLQETLKRNHGTYELSWSFQNFCKEIFDCPQLQTVVSEVFEEQELEYSECKRCTASYYLLPKSYFKSLTNHRSKLDREVLNDNLVSVGYDDESDENSQDERADSRKQIRREGASKRVPQDQRLVHEEKLFLCEDDQYELDVVRHTTASTIERLERVVKAIQNPDFHVEFFNWNEHLTPVHLRCIERIYGDYGLELIEEARKNPVIAIPIILGHLKQKEEDEWPRYQVEMDKSWAEVHAEHFHKSLDYSQTDTQDTDIVQVSMERFQPEPALNEDDREDDNEPVADAESEQPTSSLFRFKYPDIEHPDLDLMYEIIKYVLKEVQLSEELLDKIQTVWTIRGLH